MPYHGPLMTTRQRLRRVALLCVHFMRNLAYYRTGWSEDGLKKTTDFWVTVNGNFYDICILEWCKLFADKNDKHCWMKVVDDKESFERRLIESLGLSPDEYREFVESIRRYRDKFVAHLDSDPTAQLPHFEIAERVIIFYYNYLVEKNKTEEFLGTLPKNIRAYRDKCTFAGLEIYS